MTFDLLIRARRAVVDGALRPASIAVRDGRIAAVGAHDAPADAAAVVELAADEVLLPGLVDSHVHVNEPGRTEWEGFASATRAAAAGGVTTIIDMPLNSIPPTCDVAALEIKQKAARGRVHVDTGFWGGAIPGNAAELRPLHEAGVFGFKCFLLPSGVDEFPPLDEAELERAMREIAAFDGLLIVHAEDAHEITGVPPGREYQGFLRSRPPAAEQRAINTVLDLAGKTGARVHVLHLSSAAALPRSDRGPPPRDPGHRRDLPALPELRRGRHPGRRDPVQVLPADPGRRQPRRAVAGAPGRGDRLRGVRPLALHRGPEAPGHRRLRRGLGWHRLPPAWPARGVDGGPVPRRAAHRRGDLDGRPAGRAGRAGPQGRPWPPAGTPTCACSRPR